MATKSVELPMISYIETKSCLELCNGACCSNIALRFASEESLDKLDPQGNLRKELKDVLHFSDTTYVTVEKKVLEDEETIVYYHRNEFGTLDITIKGNCINKQADGKCGIYPDRPPQCHSLEIMSLQCSKARVAQGLNPLPGAFIKDQRNLLKRLLKPIKNPRAPL